MEYMAVAYGLIAVVIAAYGIRLRQQMQAARRERARLLSKEE